MSLCQTGSAADAVMIGFEIIRRDIGANNNRRVGGKAANPTPSSHAVAASPASLRESPCAAPDASNLSRPSST